jgi:hypothetical protein
MRIPSSYILPAFFALATGLGLLSCKKLVTVPQPINSITTEEIFSDDAQANTAMAGVYSQMINKVLSFTSGYASLLGGMSADELFAYATTDISASNFASNQLLYNNSYTSTFWTNLYKDIYGVNSVIEGIAASTAPALTDTTRKRLTGEAKFVRAFCYFYLVNLYGDVPLVTTVDFNKTRFMTRTPAADVYNQVLQDLKDAQLLLTNEYPTGNRIFPDKWVVTALMARVYLFMGDYADAAAQAGNVIANTSLFNLESNPNNVFLSGSKEAIWQLKQATTDNLIKNATLEGYTIIPNPTPATSKAPYCLTSTLLSAFESGDKRRTAWVNSTSFNTAGQNNYPFKYKVGSSNAVLNAPSTEYYMMIRLAEMYLIRAEAEANGATGGTAAAITDLNVVRARAGLSALSASLTQAQVIAAVAHERQIELFAEWGHRWLDLKRTGQAHSVLSAIAGKQPWAGDYQLLYPIPPTEIQDNTNLVQNPGY